MRTVTRLPKNLQTPIVSFFWTSDTEFSTFYTQQKQSARTGEHRCTPISGKQEQGHNTATLSKNQTSVAIYQKLFDCFLPSPKLIKQNQHLFRNVIFEIHHNYLILNSTSTHYARHNIKSILNIVHIYFITSNYTSTYHRNEEFCDQVSGQAVFYQFQMFNVMGKERGGD